MKTVSGSTLSSELRTILTPLIEGAIRDQIFPGCSIGVWIKGHGPYFLSWGHIEYSDASVPVTGHTLFDLASLTKPLVTTILTLDLVARGRFKLNSTLKEVTGLGPCPRETSSIEILHLLHHQSGLPSWLPLYEGFRGVAQVTQAILDTPLRSPPGTTTEYSDLGFILLGAIICELEGRSLPTLFEERILAPLGVSTTGLSFHPAMKEGVAPTQICPIRGRLIQGEVHDLNAWAMGGHGGHAGLFGSAVGLMDYLKKLYEIMAEKGYSKRKGQTGLHLLTPFLAHFSKGPYRLGFDTPSPRGSQAGTLFSQNTIGHLGYTGTSFWMDLDQGIIVLFLTNRTFPHDSPGSRKAIKEIRPRVHDLILTTLLEHQPSKKAL